MWYRVHPEPRAPPRAASFVEKHCAPPCYLHLQVLPNSAAPPHRCKHHELRLIQLSVQCNGGNQRGF
ncbi:hypothetical protein E2562_017455 [Oryza meyeriana var. granulata]|uniref:Uncharacterized protein n=1 Tax=Oryza meyeriana var. granulata TaxID=110450 RepID=A0A6G1DXQ4_9ORYZ|nr:hypothetical protein E2562_017455 [Oryza meyeriana var. granulata]